MLPPQLASSARTSSSTVVSTVVPQVTRQSDANRRFSYVPVPTRAPVAIVLFFSLPTLDDSRAAEGNLARGRRSPGNGLLSREGTARRLLFWQAAVSSVGYGDDCKRERGSSENPCHDV